MPQGPEEFNHCSAQPKFRTLEKLDQGGVVLRQFIVINIIVMCGNVPLRFACSTAFQSYHHI